MLSGPTRFPFQSGSGFINPIWPNTFTQVGLQHSDFLCKEAFLPVHGFLSSSVGLFSIQTWATLEPIIKVSDDDIMSIVPGPIGVVPPSGLNISTLDLTPLETLHGLDRGTRPMESPSLRPHPLGAWELELVIVLPPPR